MKRVPLSEVKDDLSRYVQLAAHEQIVVTRHGRPAAVLIGFEDDDDWFDYQLQHDPRFVERMEAARQSLAAGRGIPIEEVRARLDDSPDRGQGKASSTKRRTKHTTRKKASR